MAHPTGIFDCRPILCVDRVDASVTYYRDVLGFDLGWRWSDTEGRFLAPDEPGPAHTALVGAGTAQWMLVQRAQGHPGMWLHLDVATGAQVHALYADWVARGARIREAPALRPWGMVEMRIEDLDGHVFRVSGPP
ncbi:MAG: VOC family protein [Alphaproteobacteria bacterium]|nr:VOC family protein [Alphaproteobacteria bacterium]